MCDIPDDYRITQDYYTDLPEFENSKEEDDEDGA